MHMNTLLKPLFGFIFALCWTVLPAQELMYYVDMCSFYDQDGKPYMEFYLDIETNSMFLELKGPGQYSGEVEVELMVEDQNGAQVYQRVYELASGAISDTSSSEKNFGTMDIRRISLEPGKYVFTGYLKDKNLPDAKLHKFVREFEVEIQSPNFCSLSEIEFIQSFRKAEVMQGHHKHGYEILPLVTNGTYVNTDSLHYYLEAYHTDRESEEVFFVNAYITMANSESKLPGAQKIMRQTVGPLSLIQGGFDISNLPSQSYYLQIELFNKQQKSIAKGKKKFFLSNSRIETPISATEIPYDEAFNLTDEELDYYLNTLYLVSTSTEAEFAKSMVTVEQKKNFFMNFWTKRRKLSSDSPAKPFMAHKNRIDYANDHYKAAHLEGWRTDRGRIILVHGPPNDIERFPSSNTNYPYVIWRYNKIKTQANVMFVFYNPNIAIDEYVLLHSNLLGEISNPRWQYEVVRTINQGNFDNNQLFDDYSNGQGR